MDSLNDVYIKLNNMMQSGADNPDLAKDIEFCMGAIARIIGEPHETE